MDPFLEGNLSGNGTRCRDVSSISNSGTHPEVPKVGRALPDREVAPGPRLGEDLGDDGLPDPLAPRVETKDASSSVCPEEAMDEPITSKHDGGNGSPVHRSSELVARGRQTIVKPGTGPDVSVSTSMDQCIPNGVGWPHADVAGLRPMVRTETLLHIKCAGV